MAPKLCMSTPGAHSVSQSFIKMHLFSFDFVSFWPPPLFVIVTQSTSWVVALRRNYNLNVNRGEFCRRLKVPSIHRRCWNHFGEWKSNLLAADLKAALCRSKQLWLFISAPLVTKQVIRSHHHVFRESFCSIFSGDESFTAASSSLCNSFS